MGEVRKPCDSFRLCAVSVWTVPVLLPFLSASWKSCSVRVFTPPAILPRSPQLCQNGGLSVLSSMEETDKSRVDWGRQSHWTIPLMSKKTMSMLLTLLFACFVFFRCQWVWTFRVWLMFSPNAVLIVARVSVALFPRFAQNLVHTTVTLSRNYFPNSPPSGFLPFYISFSSWPCSCSVFLPPFLNPYLCSALSASVSSLILSICPYYSTLSSSVKK
jgi:hypothetical protein